MDFPSALQQDREYLLRAELSGIAGEAFRAAFGTRPLLVATAPGRVNLIGEHTDYNGGFVLPAPIDRHIAVAAGPRPDDQLVVHARDFGSLVRTPLADLRPDPRNPWANYVKGVVSLLLKDGLPVAGMNLSVTGTIPVGAGLSSSAALEVAVVYAITRLHEMPAEDARLIELCREAESEFAGVDCGIMDQFVSALGRRGHALFLDCRSLQFTQVPFPAEAELIVCYTGVPRSLSTSAYNQRRQECREAVTHLSTILPSLSSLRDVTPGVLEEYSPHLPPVPGKRARHVVTENGRVTLAVDALRRADLPDFGKLMYQSHLSLKTDFEVSSPELDAVVDLCAKAEGVYGARMTGAGFGGSAVCLVHRDAAADLIHRLETEYPAKTGFVPSVMRCTIDDGVIVSRT